ncbi:hypothetical protein GOL89_27270 [Sinorhizobium medicae]|nr:hypothetical protein [Sinorhizobium medicae]
MAFSLELVPHASDFGMTYTLPYRYTPELFYRYTPETAGRMPMFDQFLNDCWATDADYGDKLLALQEDIGVSLMGKAPQYQMAFLLFGQPGAGKSVLQSIMKVSCPSDQVHRCRQMIRFLQAEMFGKATFSRKWCLVRS